MNKDARKRSFRRLGLIINPAAGRPRPIVQVVCRTAAAAGMDWEVFVTKQKGDAARFVKKALAAKCDVVGVHGGDGTVAEAAAVLVGGAVPLLCLRGGSGNVIAAQLGVPLGLERACRLLCDGRVDEMDVGVVNRRPFLLRVSMGFEAQMVRATLRDWKQNWGGLAYALGVVKALLSARVSRYRINTPGADAQIVEGHTCIVANSGCVGITGLSLAPGVSVTDGWLDVFVVRPAGARRFFQRKNFFMDQQKHPADFVHRRIKDAVIEADPPQEIQCDGEIGPYRRLEISVRPKALKVVVPANHRL